MQGAACFWRSATPPSREEQGSSVPKLFRLPIPPHLCPLSIRFGLERPNLMWYSVFLWGQSPRHPNERGPSVSNFWDSLDARTQREKWETTTNSYLHSAETRREENFHRVNHPCPGQNFWWSERWRARDLFAVANLVVRYSLHVANLCRHLRPVRDVADPVLPLRRVHSVVPVIISLHCALSLAAQCIVIGPVCLWLCLFVGLLPRWLEIACTDPTKLGL